jgi:Family of unknown function (DUF5681)
MTLETNQDDQEHAAETARKQQPRIRGRPFRKGQSGNPAGRPKQDFDLVALARSFSEDAINLLASIAADETAPAMARVKAASALLDRAYGRPRQAVKADHQVSLQEQFENFIRELNGLKPIQR